MRLFIPVENSCKTTNISNCFAPPFPLSEAISAIEIVRRRRRGLCIGDRAIEGK